MKVSAAPLAVVLAAATAALGSAGGAQARKADTITQVVQLLQEMLDKSKEAAGKEHELYAKYKCYCDDNTVAKTTSIQTMTTKIGMLDNKIEALLGSSGQLSSESAQLSQGMAENEQMRQQAQALRTKAKDAFEAEETDLTAAIGQLGQAVEVLAAIGSDQSMAAAADHAKFMAGHSGKYSLAKLKSSMKQALLAASTFLTPAQRRKVDVFLQTPFTGTYTAQSASIIGILKQMKDTFTTNLVSAQTNERRAVEAHSALMATKLAEHGVMKSSYDGKQATLSSNDEDLSSKRTQLSEAIRQKEDDEAFLAKLGTLCEAKAKEFGARKLFRANEDAAISKAIAILNSDKAFATFGTVKATGGGAGSFLQLSVVRRHGLGRRIAGRASPRQLARQVLQRAALGRGSRRLGRIAALLDAGNPFTKVLEEIENMKGVIAEEGKVDKKQFDWCASERQLKNGDLQEKVTQIEGLNGAITALETSIEDPMTGFKAMIQQNQEDLETNRRSQTDETKTRREENKVYQENIENVVTADGLLEKAITVLVKYYDDLQNQTMQELGFLQQDPTPPDTWTGSYSGQSEQGNSVISMLKTILQNTRTEEQTAHADEDAAQTSYEDSMASLKTEEGDLETAIADNQKLLADAEKDLEGKRADLDETERDKISIERYLEQIKPGCDFVTNNFADRERYRGEETSALDNAVSLLKASPAFAAATLQAKHDAFGECKEKCIASEADAACKACMAKTSVPGYCAGHPSTPGCPP